MSKELAKKLVEIQSKLKAPKGQMNKFGGYAYRSCEDILEAVKPLLAAQGLFLTIDDDITSVGSEGDVRIYVKATASLSDGECEISVNAFAREAITQKGMGDSQITGSASSYARKYALNGLFLIDDTKDADATNDHGKSSPKKTTSRDKKEDKPVEKVEVVVSEENTEASEAPKSGLRKRRR